MKWGSVVNVWVSAEEVKRRIVYCSVKQAKPRGVVKVVQTRRYWLSLEERRGSVRLKPP